MAKVGGMDEWFPKAENKPITIRQAWCGVIEEVEPDCDISRFAIGMEWYRLRSGQKSNKYLSLVKPSLDAPSPTITKGVGTTASLASVTHPLECRKYTRIEAKRIASFPDNFLMEGSWSQGLERIGNSVPPLFMRSIARNVKNMLQTGQPYRQTAVQHKVDYPAILAQAWAQHLAPRANDAPTVISTFAGAGGSSLGYSMAGFRELLAVEWDDNAVATFKLNFPDVPVYHGDITKLSVEQVLDMTGLRSGQLDVFDGSPPCQGFSTAGKRVMDDPRNQLFREFVRLLQGLRPKVFVMENVSGMVKGKMKLVFVEILKELKASGYKVSARLLNAMYFNVPQSRERMIFIGVREDFDVTPSHPKAENKSITTRQAFDGVQNCTFLTSFKPRPLQMVDRVMWSKTPSTIVKTAGSIMSKTVVHPSEDRHLTLEEAKRIGSFPDGFKMVGKFDNQWARIGNSVPPLFMRSIARHIRSEILSQKPTLLEAA